jgi:hypothetical protein
MKNKILFLSLLSTLTLQVNAEIIHATSNIQSFDLTGDNGRDGYRGSNCEDGEDGQNGYTGEDATVFYSQTDQLKNITLTQTGGAGGLGGDRGSRYNCESNQGYNHDGDNGYSGSYGKLFLVKNRISLEAQVKQIITPIAQVNGRLFKFKNHDWNKKTGAKSLFSKDSDIQNNYKEYISTVTTPYLVTIDDNVSLNDIQGYNLNLIYSLTNENRFKLKIAKEKYDSGLLLDYHVTKVKSINEVVISKIYSRKLIKNTQFLGVSGEGSNTTLSFSDETLTDETIDLTTGGRVYHYSRFIDHYVIDRTFSSSALTVTKKGNIYKLKIGDHEKLRKLFKKGEKFRIKMGFYKKRGKSKTSYSKIIEFQL